MYDALLTVKGKSSEMDQRNSNYECTILLKIHMTHGGWQFLLLFRKGEDPLRHIKQEEVAASHQIHGGV
jgi:hypothetical protein